MSDKFLISQIPQKLSSFISRISSEGEYDSRSRAVMRKIFSTMNCSKIYMHATEYKSAAGLTNDWTIYRRSAGTLVLSDFEPNLCDCVI